MSWWRTLDVRVIFDGLILLGMSALWWANVHCIRPHGYWFFVCYFNDLCCGPWFMSYTNLLLATISRRIARLKHILIYLFIWSVAWEVVGPIISRGSTGDVCDILAYLVGGIVYYIIHLFVVSSIKRGRHDRT